ncbi:MULTISPECIES: DNA-3-methyladenine glycosylase family protein [Bordetella]|uniref:DNA-3-methyladenine glycosylase II n=2 Tax=Bordetella TaxID=517 RepID=K0MA61_BORPB|nr:MULTISPECIES: DNA-3-methyladenine glycosylase [Bordetella]KAK66056.1 base excision DNA repair protein, HhH-GPD family [Bordetella bronchiseptica 980-2]AMG87689.1 DNA-3-methyladenine glycosylase [Bordetella bronchiseptica]AWP78886.1 DNA-3-methyladenine glycosylase [Bordetella bronchiseptica]AWP83696.1 DNA-3-methyladenine glycosylase [Bordetella bronchiseptica]AWQ09264.1 DNA-3-methyladenine glycosylase [Bordetella bronchiseptica]
MTAATLSPAAYAHAERFLAGLDADWRRHVAATGACLHRPLPAREPYEALVRAIAYQQLHARAGDAIVGRLLALFPGGAFPAPGQLLAADPAALRACGFSAAKTQTILGIAQAARDGVVPDRRAARRMSDQALVERLTTLRGVGRWTVEMLLIYTLARADILPADDFGVRDGYRRLKGGAATPTARQMRDIGQAWGPYRTLAAWYLWRVPPEARIRAQET